MSPVWPAERRSERCCWYSASLTTFTLKSITEWYSPQSSAHLPAYVPSRVGVNDHELSRPMYMSFLYRKSMIQKEWMTSRDWRSMRTVLFTGRYRVGSFDWS